MSVLLFSGLVGPVNRFPGWEAVQWWYISKAAGELEALHMEVPKVRRGFLSLETSRWHVLLDELGVCKPDCWSPSGSVCCLALGLCECPGQSEVEVPHLWPLLHPCADSMPGSKSTSKGHKLASVWWTSWWSSCASAERPDSAVLWLEGWRAAWVWRWLCQRGGSDKVSALRSRTCSCPLCIFLSPFPLPTRLSIFCLQCLFLITPFMTWPGIRF